MGLEVGGGGTEEEEKEEVEEKEKIPLCESIGHRPLRGRCPVPTLYYNLDLPKQGTGTAGHLTLLRLFLSLHLFSPFPPSSPLRKIVAKASDGQRYPCPAWNSL